MVIKEIIFDSNVWISYFHTDDTNHKQAVAAFKEASSATIVLTEYVLLEITTLLKQKIGPEKTNKLLEVLLQSENIRLLPSSNFFTATVRTFVTSTEKHLSFVDVSLLVLSRDFSVVTFDKRLQTAIKKLMKERS